MLFTQFNMDDALEVRYEEGVEDGMERGLTQGLEQGRTQGERRLLVHLVCGKLQKGESVERIAEDLLADEAQIRRICEAIAACGPEETDISRWLEKDDPLPEPERQ